MPIYEDHNFKFIFMSRKIYPGFNPKVSSGSLRKNKIAVTYTAVKKIHKIDKNNDGPIVINVN